MLSAPILEARLREQLEMDRKRPSRIMGTLDDGTVMVNPSGVAIGLAIAIAAITHEDVMTICDRVGNPDRNVKRDVVPTFTLEIRVEGDWMSTGPLSNNLAYLLENVAGKLLRHGVDNESAILDGNGNTIGRYIYNA